MRSTRTGIDTPDELQHGVATQGIARVVDKRQIAQSDTTDPGAGQDEQCLLHGVEGEGSMRRDKSLLLTRHGGPQRETSCSALQDGIEQGIGPRPVHRSTGGERHWIEWWHRLTCLASCRCYISLRKRANAADNLGAVAVDTPR